MVSLFPIVDVLDDWTFKFETLNAKSKGALDSLEEMSGNGIVRTYKWSRTSQRERAHFLGTHEHLKHVLRPPQLWQIILLDAQPLIFLTTGERGDSVAALSEVFRRSDAPCHQSKPLAKVWTSSAGISPALR